MPVARVPLLAWEQRAIARAAGAAGERSLTHARRALDAAIAVMEAGEELTTTRLATRAGMSLKTLYRYFASKDELLLALYEHATAQTASTLRTEISGLDPVTGIDTFIRELFAATWRNPLVARTFIEGHWRLSRQHPVELEASRRPYVELLADLIAVGVAGGQLRPDAGGTDAHLIVSLILTRLHAAATHFDDVYDEAEARSVSAFCLHALGASPRAPGARRRRSAQAHATRTTHDAEGPRARGEARASKGRAVAGGSAG